MKKKRVRVVMGVYCGTWLEGSIGKGYCITWLESVIWDVEGVVMGVRT